MVRFYGFSRNELDSTQGAPIFLSLEQHQPLFRVGFPSYLSLLALYPVLFERWVIGGISPCDLGEACDRGCIGLDQFCLSFPVECPVAVALEGADYPPFTSFLRMSAFCPYPKHLPLGMSNLLKDMFGCTVSGVVCPSSYHRIERPNNLHCQGLLMCVQVGTYVPYVFTDFFLLWDGQQLSLLPEFPDVKPQEVKSFCDMHNPGFSFTECQSSFLEKLLQAWSGVGFQYFSCGGRCHTVIGIAYNCYAFIDSLAKGWGFRSSIGVFCVEQPFHPIQCHICQQWRNYPSLWCPCICGREEADFDHSCFQPLTQCGGEYRQFGQQRAMVNSVKTSAYVSIKHPLTTILAVHSCMDGFNSIHGAAPWSKSIGVRLKAMFPFWLQSCFDNCLHHPVLSGRYAQGSLLAVVFGDIHPSDRLRLVPLQAQALLKQLPPGFRSVVHHSINSGGVFSLVCLGDTSDCQEFVGRGSNKQFLEIFDLPPCFVRCGAIDTFLQSSYILFHVVPIDVSPRGGEVVFSPFEERFHRLTSPKMRTLLDFSTVRTRRKAAPFRVGYVRMCGPIRPATGRHSLSPSSATLCSISLPYGWATTARGEHRAYPGVSMKKNVARLGLSRYPGGRLGCRHPQHAEVIRPTYHFGYGLSASLAV